MVVNAANIVKIVKTSKNSKDIETSKLAILTLFFCLKICSSNSVSAHRKNLKKRKNILFGSGQNFD